MKKIKSSLHFVFFLAGLLLFGLSLSAVSLSELGGLLGGIGGFGLLVFAFYPVMTLWDIWAWQAVFPSAARPKARFFELLLIRTAGEAVNNITPFLDIGGEPLKVVLVSQRLGVSRRLSLAATVMTRTTLLFAEVLFVAFGLALSLALLPLDPGWRAAFGFSLAIFLGACLVLIGAQKKGFFLLFLRWLEHWGLDQRVLDQASVPLNDVDEEIASFYSAHWPQLALSIVFNFVGWLFGGIEVYWMAGILGSPLTLWQSVMIEALIQLVRTVTFMIPANLGTQEGALSIFMKALGYDPVFGIALSLFKRVRQLFWTAVGFAIWAVFQKIEPRAKSPVSR